MALLASPRKQTVPLATGEEKPSFWKRLTQNPVTKRVFFCSVVVENPDNGTEYSPELQDFVAQFGDPLDLDGDLGDASDSASLAADVYSNEPYARKRSSSSLGQTPTITAPSRPSQPHAPLPRATPHSHSVALTDVIKELVTTERSYVKRLRILRDEYAKPLRDYSRTKDTLIIPPYEAKVLFGNVDQLLPVNEAFLEDLEKMLTPDGHDLVGGVGDVALKHFKDLKGFECYRQYYAKREEAQAIFEREIRKGSQLATFIDRIKYAAADVRNRVGLRELLMEPVQRIPRYTLLFREMIKRMDLSDPQRTKLLEADEHASRIAQAVPDEQTKRAAMWYCFSATVEDFPANLVSNARKFIDCIDVDDVLVHDRLLEADRTPGGTIGILHCSLLLFDDRLVILKRPNSERGVRALTGLAQLETSTKAQPFTPGLKKSGIQFKGMVELTDVVSTDVGGSDFHLFLEAPPIDDSERWSGRPFRSYSVINTTSPGNLDPKRTEADKRRFLDNLWTAQARYRTKNGQSVVVATEEQQVDDNKGRSQIAKTYFNIYQRTAFLQEPRKTKIVVQIDPSGSADPIPFGVHGPPYVLIRVQPMVGELSRYCVSSNSPNEINGDDDNHVEEDIVQSIRVPERIVQTIHVFGLFNFRTGNLSMPGTPTASIRSKAAIFGLDALSRNLFHGKSGAGRNDVFGGSTNPTSVRRHKTTASSRASVSTNSRESSLWSRSRSNSTSATTSSLHNSSMSSRNSRSSRRSSSISKAKKLIKRKLPPSAVSDESESEIDPIQERSTSRASANEDAFVRATSTEPDTDYSDYYEDYEDPPARGSLNESERDLTARLQLAKRNSQNQHEIQYDAMGREIRAEETIYESEWDDAGRPASRASQMSRNRDLPNVPAERHRASRSSEHSRGNSITPTRASEKEDGSGRSRASSLQPPARKVHGPRSPSPSSRPITPVAPLPSMDDELALEDARAHAEHMLVTPRRTDHSASPLPRSKRQPFEQTPQVDATPRPTTYDEELPETPSVEPLVIKRKGSMQFHSRRKHGHGQRTPSMTKSSSSSRKSSSSLRQTSSTTKHQRPIAAVSVPVDIQEAAKRVITLTDDTKQQLATISGDVQRIKLEYERMLSSKDMPLVLPSSPTEMDRVASPTKMLRTPLSPTDIDRIASPTKMLRTPPRPPSSAPKTKEAQERMDEMIRLIKHRRPLTLSESRSESRADSPAPSPAPAPAPSPAPILTRTSTPAPTPTPVNSKAIEELSAQLDAGLQKAVQNQATIQTSLEALNEVLIAKSLELERTKAELQNVKLQKEVIRRLHDDSMAEKEIMYEAFNEELDLMFKSVQQGGDDNWQAMAEELHHAKITAKTLEKEKALLQHQLADRDIVLEEMQSLLRIHGLIP